MWEELAEALESKALVGCTLDWRSYCERSRARLKPAVKAAPRVRDPSEKSSSFLLTLVIDGTDRDRSRHLLVLHFHGDVKLTTIRAELVGSRHLSAVVRPGLND